jgi:hypothetical protein
MEAASERTWMYSQHVSGNDRQFMPITTIGAAMNKILKITRAIIVIKRSRHAGFVRFSPQQRHRRTLIY